MIYTMAKTSSQSTSAFLLSQMVAQCEDFMTNRFITFSSDRFICENLHPSMMDTNVNCAAVMSTNVKHLTVNTETGH